MSVFNGGRHLDDSIASVLSQTYKNFEFIITNDNSTDDSLSVLEKFQRNDDRILVINNSVNLGLPHSLNNMIKMATGKYIVRMDADDICFPNRFERQLDFLLNNGADINFSSTMLIDENNVEICESWRPASVKKILEYMPDISFIPHPTVMIDKAVFSLFGLYNEQYKTAQDWELWNRLIRNGVNFSMIREPLLRYRVNPDSSRKGVMSVISREYDNFEKAKICIANRNKKLALFFSRNSSFWHRLYIILRVLTPHFFLLRLEIWKRRYSPNSVTKKIRKKYENNVYEL